MVYCEIKNLTVSYDDRAIIENLTLDIKKGEVLLLTGPTGGGKSSLLYSINGVIPSYYNSKVLGDILIEGKSIMSLDISQRSKLLGSVLQSPRDQIVFEIVEDELVFPMENLGFSSEKITNNLKRIYNDYDIKPFDQTQTLSGGQAQSLVTEGTMVMDQKMFLLDEPLANLDNKRTDEFLRRVESLKRQGKTIVIAEHRIDKVIDVIDKVLWLDHNSHKIFEIDQFREFIKNRNKKLDTRSRFKSLKSDDCLIDIKDLSWNIKDSNILKNINLKINRGDKWVLLGDNGAGKTSLLNQIMKLNKPTSGSIDYYLETEDIYKGIGYILQDPDYQLFMPTVYEEVNVSSISSTMSEYVLESLDLKEYVNDHPHSLSQGQKRRLAVGAVIASKPEVLIFDEPTVGQDQKSLSLILKTIEDIYKEDQLTMVTISHDMNIWENIGDKYMLMDAGNLKVLNRGEYERYISSMFK